MTVTPAENLEPLLPILGRWRTSGSVLDEDGAVSTSIAGTDVYALLPGGAWIAHDVDVRIGGERTLAHELIGGVHPEGGWQMHSFDAADGPSGMRLSQEAPDLLLLQGVDVRSWFRFRAGHATMTTLWERRTGGRWIPWMDMQFDRVDG